MNSLNLLDIGLKIIIAIGIINVWFFRFNQPTTWRGGGASSMNDEFKSYGLSTSLVPVIGGLKILAALGFVVSIWYEQIEIYSSVLMGLLMLGAISMHLKISDPIKRSLPAFLMLVMSIVVIFI